MWYNCHNFHSPQQLIFGISMSKCNRAVVCSPVVRAISPSPGGRWGWTTSPIIIKCGMWGSVLTGGESPGAQGAAPLPRGGSQGCHPCEGRSCPHPILPQKLQQSLAWSASLQPVHLLEKQWVLIPFTLPKPSCRSDLPHRSHVGARCHPKSQLSVCPS